MGYDLNKLRQKMKEKSNNRFKDPAEFRFPQVKEGENKKYRFFILPPLEQDDTCADGAASRSMELFYVANGYHRINNKSYQCPRIHDDDTCPMCQWGFDLMSENPDKKYRSGIAKKYLSNARYAVNVYFPNNNVNPEEVRGKVMWINAPKTLYDIWEACLMNDDEGDPQDPQAHGIFFDEKAAYLFQVELKQRGDFNDYSGSKFMTGAGVMPIAASKDGGKIVPDNDKIKAILDQRHDLFTKFDTPDIDKLSDIVANLASESPIEDDDNGFDEDDAKPSRPAAKSSKPKATKTEDDVSSDIAGEISDEPVTESAESAGAAGAAGADSDADDSGSDNSDSDDMAELEALLGQID